MSLFINTFYRFKNFRHLRPQEPRYITALLPSHTLSSQGQDNLFEGRDSEISLTQVQKFNCPWRWYARVSASLGKFTNTARHPCQPHPPMKFFSPEAVELPPEETAKRSSAKLSTFFFRPGLSWSVLLFPPISHCIARDTRGCSFRNCKK